MKVWFINCKIIVVFIDEEVSKCGLMVYELIWHCIKYDILIFGDLRDRYLMLFLLLDYVGVFDYSGGVLRVDKVFRVF